MLKFSPGVDTGEVKYRGAFNEERLGLDRKSNRGRSIGARRKFIKLEDLLPEKTSIWRGFEAS